MPYCPHTTISSGIDSNLISALCTAGILIATVFYVVYTKRYLNATKEIMRTSAESLEFSRESFLTKEKPFVTIKTFNNTDRYLIDRNGAGEEDFTKHIWYDIKEIILENSGEALATIINGVDISYDIKFYPNQFNKVDTREGQDQPPIKFFRDKIFIAPNQERIYKVGVNKNWSNLEGIMGYSSDVTVKVDYTGINNDTYTYTYRGHYDHEARQYIQTNEDYTQNTGNSTKATTEKS